MIKKIAFLLFLLPSLSSWGQRLVTEASYYTDEEELVRIERKYVDGTSLLYVVIGTKNIFCLKTDTSYNRDTTLIKEEYYTVLEKPINTEEEEQKRNNRLPLILNHSIDVRLDSIFLQETRIAYFVNNFPIKSDHFAHSLNHAIFIRGVLSPGRVIYRSYFLNQLPIPYQIDTITWNKDTSIVESHSKREDWQPSKTQYQIKGNHLTSVYNDTSVTHIEYLNGKTLFNNILTKEVLYFDIYFDSYLFFFDREQEVSIKSKTRDIVSTYTYDKKHRVIEEKLNKKGKYWGKTIYKYYDE